MSKPEPTAADIARLEQASDWVQRLRGSNDQALTDQWLHWCRCDKQNLPAFEQMQHLWNAFAVGKSLSLAPRPVKRPNRLMAWAAGLVLAVGMAAWLTQHYSHVQALETPVGQQRHFTLADGSVLDLAPGSRLGIHFTLATREVRLERGQAFFAVAHGTLRPFVVQAGGVTVQAVGTTFDVRTGPGSTVVTVGAGTVKITPGTDAALHLAAGQRVEFERHTHRARIATVNPDVAGSWRGGTLQFLGDSLEDVAGTVNRYNTAQIEVAPALRGTRFTGTLSPTDMRDWLRALEQIYAVEVVDQGTHGVLIESRADEGRYSRLR